MKLCASSSGYNIAPSPPTARRGYGKNPLLFYIVSASPRRLFRYARKKERVARQEEIRIRGNQLINQRHPLLFARGFSGFSKRRRRGEDRRAISARTGYHSIDPADDRLPVRRPATAIILPRSRGNRRARACEPDETRIYLAVSILNLFKYKLHTSV